MTRDRKYQMIVRQPIYVFYNRCSKCPPKLFLHSSALFLVCRTIFGRSFSTLLFSRVLGSCLKTCTITCVRNDKSKGPSTLATLFSHRWPRFCGGDIYSRRKPLFSSFGEHTAVCGSSVRQAVARPHHRQSVCIHNIHVAATCRPSVLGSATKTRPPVAKQSGQCARALKGDEYGGQL